MVPRVTAIVPILALEHVSGLHTAAESQVRQVCRIAHLAYPLVSLQVQMLREEFRGLSETVSREFSHMSKRIDDLSAAFHEFVRAGGAAKAGDEITAGPGLCEYEDSQWNKLSISLTSPEHPYPISGTALRGKDAGLTQIKFNKHFTELSFFFSPNSLKFTVTDHVEQAIKHFAPLIYFAKYSEEVMMLLRSFLPITERDNLKCRKIFSLLADNPPPGYTGSSTPWFKNFQGPNPWDFFRSWKYGVRRGLISH